MFTIGIKLENGDYALGKTGNILDVHGEEEIISRALIRLKAKKGGFPLDLSLGSEIYLSDINKLSYESLFSMVSEALAPIPEIEVSDIEKNIDKENQRLYLTIYMKVKKREVILELSEQEKTDEKGEII